MKIRTVRYWTDLPVGWHNSYSSPPALFTGIPEHEPHASYRRIFIYVPFPWIEGDKPFEIEASAEPLQQ